MDSRCSREGSITRSATFFPRRGSNREEDEEDEEEEEGTGMREIDGLSRLEDVISSGVEV